MARVASESEARVIDVPPQCVLRYAPSQCMGHVIRFGKSDDIPNVELLRRVRPAIVLTHAAAEFARKPAEMAGALEAFRRVCDEDGTPVWGYAGLSGCTTLVEGNVVHVFAVMEHGRAVMDACYRMGEMCTMDAFLKAQKQDVASALHCSRAFIRRCMGACSVQTKTELVGNVMRAHPSTGKLEFLSGAFDTCVYSDIGTRNNALRAPKPWLTVKVPGVDGTLSRLIYDDKADVCFPEYTTAPQKTAARNAFVDTIMPGCMTDDPRRYLNMVPLTGPGVAIMSSTCGGPHSEDVKAPPEAYDVYTTYHIAEHKRRLELFGGNEGVK